jgi:hypothetical protein
VSPLPHNLISGTPKEAQSDSLVQQNSGLGEVRQPTQAISTNSPSKVIFIDDSEERASTIQRGGASVPWTTGAYQALDSEAPGLLGGREESAAENNNARFTDE